MAAHPDALRHTVSARAATVLLWVGRIAWVAVLVVGPNAVSMSTASALIGATVWAAGLISFVLPSTATLTALRLVVPLSMLGASTAAIVSGLNVWTVATLTSSAVATIVTWSSDVGHQYVQASAYGDERRFLLRPPVVYLGLAVVNWAVFGTALTVAVLWFDAAHFVPGAVALLVSIATGVWGIARWHKLSRRWLVLVPAGMVFHDHLLLAETTMTPRFNVTSVEAGADPEAFDLARGALGDHVVIGFAEPVMLLLAATPQSPRGSAVHAGRVEICPSRPGRLIAGWHTRRGRR